jgi:hypothetical protein
MFISLGKYKKVKVIIAKKEFKDRILESKN